ncbi:hypothetical protein NDU88_003376 [Pleurodeles waltl]|uniref:Uncharacterized protein n=1 Tax=Pleurodeles waltl TaxID=8319 RepID=A0AAV7TNA2_PLEWA|nr:hypothetical protein NDU88_003376 [Pleurodeles waltl]
MLGCTVRTIIHTWEKSVRYAWQVTEHDELAEMDRAKKAKIKEYADRRRRAQSSTVQKATMSLQCMLVIRAVQARPAFDFIRVALVPGPSFTVHRGCCFPICDRVGDLQRLEGQARFACLLGRV